MPVAVHCPECRTKWPVKEELAGQLVNCPACQHPMGIPAPDGTVPFVPRRRRGGVMVFLWASVMLMIPVLVSANFTVIPGPVWSTLVGRIGPGPDPNTHTQAHQYGYILPWMQVTHEWNESTSKNVWKLDYYRRERLSVHLAILGLGVGLAIILWPRRRVRVNLAMSSASSIIACGMLWCAWWELPAETRPASPETSLFNFEDPTNVRDWSAVKLPGVENDQPAPKIEIVVGKTSDRSEGKFLQITFAGGDWPAIGTSKIPVAGNWKEFQTLQAVLRVDRPSVAYFRICQEKTGDKGKQPCWEKTMILQPGLNPVNLTIRHGLGSSVIDPAKGDVTSFSIGMFRPEKGQTLQVGSIRLTPEWPAPKAVGWYSPYNHDGYSAAVARECERTGVLPRFQVLGTDLEVADLPDLAKRLKDKWTKPEPKTIEQLEAEFKAEFEKLRKGHPKAVLAILRDGEKGWDPANPDKVYAGWKMVYTNSHGPDGPNKGRENTPKLADTVEVFMRHRSVLMRPDLSSIPGGSAILAAKLIVTARQQWSGATREA